jgi:hypothetical protein
MDHTDSKWYALYADVINTNPFCVTDEQLFAVFSALRSECGRERPGTPTPDLKLLPAHLWPGELMVVRVTNAMWSHVQFEYTRQHFDRIMLRVVESKCSVIDHVRRSRRLKGESPS